MMNYINLKTDKIDLIDLVEETYKYVIDYFNDSDIHISFKEKSFIIKTIFNLLVGWSTTLTKPVLKQDLINELLNFKDGEILNGQGISFNPYIDATIVEAIEFKDSASKALTIKQSEVGNSLFTFYLHDALLPFFNRFLKPERNIHIANLHSILYMIVPNQLVIIDLEKTEDDILFIKSTSGSTLKKACSSMNSDGSYLVKIVKVENNDIHITDGTDCNVKFRIWEHQMLLKLIFYIDDVIIIHKPEIFTEKDDFFFMIGPETVFFRVPVYNKDADRSQLNYIVERSHGSAETLILKDSMVYDVSGCCKGIKHIYSSQEEWIYSELILDTNDIILVHPDMIHVNYLNTIFSIRKNHYVWLFGLEKMDKSYAVIKTSGVYNCSVLNSLLNSNIYPFIPLSMYKGYKSFITRAVIVDIDMEFASLHTVCKSFLDRNGRCSICSQSNTTSKKKDGVIFSLVIDDGFGSLDVVAGNHSIEKLNINFNIADRNDLKSEIFKQICGNECIFSISKGSGKEFGRLLNSHCWRVDACVERVGDAQIVVDDLLEFFNNNDNLS